MANVFELVFIVFALFSFVIGCVLILGGFLLNGRIMALFIGTTNVIISTSFLYVVMVSRED